MGALKPQEQEREFAFTDKDFATLVALVRERTGIALGDHKKQMVYGRLAKRVRLLGFTQFADYIAMLGTPEGDGEVVNFVNAITTNLTSFFREAHHFDHLGEQLAKHTASPLQDKRIRIWSAGCSSGMEPYSIAMTALEHIDNISRWDLKILATDIDTNMLDNGSLGAYPNDSYEKVPSVWRSKYTQALDGQPRTLQMDSRCRELIHFKQLNLLSPWPIKGPFDMIFCRNVMIYFDKETQEKLLTRFANIIRPGGWLYIGHSENMHGLDAQFHSCGRTIYQRSAA